MDSLDVQPSLGAVQVGGACPSGTDSGVAGAARG